MDLVSLNVRKLALRGHGQRAKRDGDDGEDGSPGSYDANAHDRTLPVGGPRRETLVGPAFELHRT